MSTGFAYTAAGVTVAYAGCVLLFQGGAKRTTHEAIRIPSIHAAKAKATGWLLLLGAIWPLALTQGFERGIPVWVGVVGLCGILSLLISAFWPRAHFPSALVVAGLATVMALGDLIWSVGDFS